MTVRFKAKPSTKRAMMVKTVAMQATAVPADGIVRPVEVENTPELFATHPLHYSRSALAEVEGFPQRVRRFADLKHRIGNLEDEAETLRAAIAAEMSSNKVAVVVAAGQKIARTAVAGRSSLDKLLLISAGVTEDQLKRGTKVGAPSFRLEVEEFKGGKTQ